MPVLIEWDGKNYHETSDLRSGNGSSELPYFNRGVKSSGDLSAMVVPMDPSIQFASTNELAEMHNAAVDKLSDRLQNIENYFEALYERKEAIALATSAAKELLRFVKNYKKPQYWRKVQKVEPKDLPSAWLTYQFGIKPLIGTIDSASRLLAKDWPTVTERGYVTRRFSYSDKAESPWAIDYKTGSNNVGYELRAHVKPRYNPNGALLNALGLTTPLSTMSSVIPWGWAVNYFVNVSDVLTNLENRFPGIEIESVWRSVSCKGHFQQKRLNLDEIYGEDGTYVTHTGEFHNFWREAYHMDYALEFGLPNFGTNQFANLMSAIAVTISGANRKTRG